MPVWRLQTLTGSHGLSNLPIRSDQLRAGTSQYQYQLTPTYERAGRRRQQLTHARVSPDRAAAVEVETRISVERKRSDGVPQCASDRRVRIIPDRREGDASQEPCRPPSALDSLSTGSWPSGTEDMSRTVQRLPGRVAARTISAPSPSVDVVSEMTPAARAQAIGGKAGTTSSILTAMSSPWTVISTNRVLR